MEKHKTARFEFKKEDILAKYIHKYYLPLELRPKISPADVATIDLCFIDEFDVWEKKFPKKVPGCVITYEDLGMEKRIDGETNRQVLLAYMAYWADRRAKLTPEELQAAINLNDWLIDWEKQLLPRLIQISEAMERQIRSSDGWLTDYEIDVTVDFFVREDDPYSYENMPDSYKHFEDCSTLCTAELLSHPLSAANAAKGDYFGIGDSVNHNERRHFSDAPEDQIRHCLTFHELYDHLDVPMKHMIRIGRVFTDIVVRHQSGIDIDLAGDCAVTVLDEANIRENVILPDEM